MCIYKHTYTIYKYIYFINDEYLIKIHSNAM